MARAGAHMILKKMNVVGTAVVQSGTGCVAVGMGELFAYHGDVVRANIWIQDVYYKMSRWEG